MPNKCRKTTAFLSFPIISYDFPALPNPCTRPPSWGTRGNMGGTSDREARGRKGNLGILRQFGRSIMESLVHLVHLGKSITPNLRYLEILWYILEKQHLAIPCTRATLSPLMTTPWVLGDTSGRETTGSSLGHGSLRDHQCSLRDHPERMQGWESVC